LVLAGALAAATTLDDAERAFAAFQDADDAARRAPSARRLRARDAKAGEALARLEAADAAGIGPEDVRALETMRRALARSGGTDDALSASIYELFGHAAEAIPFEGESLDRLSILGRLAAEPDPKRRKRLFLALSGVWESVAGRRGGASPFAQLVASRREAWARDPAGSPFEGKAREWGLEPAELERWLVRVL